MVVGPDLGPNCLQRLSMDEADRPQKYVKRSCERHMTTSAIEQNLSRDYLVVFNLGTKSFKKLPAKPKVGKW